MAYRVGMIDFVLEPERPAVTGLSDLVWQVAARLSARGDEVHVIGPYRSTPELPPGPILHTIALPPIGYRNVLGHILICMRAASELARIGRLDLVHCQEYLSTAVLALAVPDVPLVLTTPGNIYERIAHGNPFDPWTTQVYKVAARLTARRASAIIAVSGAMRSWWQWTGAPPERITLLPNGVDSAQFPPVPLRERSAADPLNLLFAARFSPENGLEELLRGLALARDRGVDARLTAVGDGPDRASSERLAADLGIGGVVAFPGWVSPTELHAAYANCDCFVACHRSAGLPRVLQQAMIVGRPVIGANATGISDHIRDGETGLLVPVDSAPGLADAIVRLAEDPGLARALVVRGQSHAAANFAWDSIIDQLRSTVYSRVVGGDASRRSGGVV